MTPEAKVVTLRQPGGERGSLPAPLARLRDHAAGWLQALLEESLDKADDALFALSEKAGSNAEQTAYFDAMRELRLQRQGLTLAYLQWVARAFNEIGRFDPHHRLTAQPESGSDRDTLSLVDDSALEERVALDNMVTRVRNRYNEQILLLHVRVEHLLPAVKVALDCTPLGPQVLCQGLGEACAELDMDISAKLVIFKLFDKYFTAGFATFYEAANARLVEDGVLPELRRPPAAGSSRQTTAPRTYAAVSQNLGQDSGYTESGPSVTFAELSDLLHGASIAEGLPIAEGSETGNVSTAHLLALLNGVQGKLQQPGVRMPAGSDLRNLVGRLIAHQRAGSGQVERVNADVISLVSMLFDFVLEDRQLPEPMKALLAKLQIPILKVALLDRNFFNRGGHPARKLLNELAMAAVGWMPKKEGQRDPLREKIEYIVERFINEFESDIGLIQVLLDDFEQFMDLDRRRRDLVEQRLRDAEEGKARSDQAKSAVDEVLAECRQGFQIPEAALPLITDAWPKVLHWFYLREGNQGENWLHASATLELLAWSVDPRPVASGTRTALLKAIPQVTDAIREGLQTIGWDPFSADKLMRDLEMVHVDVLQALDLAEAAVENETPVKSEGLLDTPVPDAPVALQAQPEPEIQPLAQSQPAAEAPARVETVAADAALADAEVQAAEPIASDPVQDKPIAGAEPAADSVAPEPASVEVADAVGADASTPTEAVTGEWLQKAQSMGVGSWLELQEASGTKLRCKLAAVIKATGKYIFANRNGTKVAEYQLEQVAEALALGHLVILDDGLIFDRALESVIGNLRSSRKD